MLCAVRVRPTTQSRDMWKLLRALASEADGRKAAPGGPSKGRRSWRWPPQAGCPAAATRPAGALHTAPPQQVVSTAALQRRTRMQ